MKNKLALVVFCCSLLGIVNTHAEQKTVEDHELNAGPVKIKVHEDCEIDEFNPSFKSYCNATATLNYDQAQLTVNEIALDGGIPQGRFAYSADNVAWVDNRFVSLAYWSTGNCVGCVGVHVVAFEDGKFYNLGKFREYKDGSWTKLYSNLAVNSITGNASAPLWSLYFSYANHEAALDIVKTCDAEKTNYASAKDEVSKSLPLIKKNLKKMKTRDYELWFEDSVGAPLLYTLGLSKFCGWKDDYAGLWEAASKKMSHQVMAKFENDLANVVYATVSE